MKTMTKKIHRQDAKDAKGAPRDSVRGVLALLIVAVLVVAQDAPPPVPSEETAQPAAPAEENKQEEKKEEKPWHDVTDADVETDADRASKRPLPPGGWLITNATIITLTDAGTIENGYIDIAGNGQIRAIGEGKDTPISESAQLQIDAKGLFVIPGIIDCHSHIAIDGDVNEGTDAVVPEVGIPDVLNPNDVAIYRAAAGGATAANLLHGSANPIGGRNAVIQMRYKVTPAELLFPDAPPGVKFALGENVKQSNWDTPTDRFPHSRMGVEATYRRAFTAALEYKKEWADYEAKKAAGEDPLPPRRDFRLETLAGILDGEVLVHCHSYRADEILMMIRVAEEFGFKIQTFQHVLEGFKVAPEMAAHGVGGSTFADWWAYKIEAYDAIPHNAALMTRAGIVTSINSDSDDYIRRLNQEAAKTVKYGGLNEVEALKLVTLNPAIQLKIDEWTGSIEPGKRADLAIYNGHPLSPYSRCVMTLVNGEVVFEDREVPMNATQGFSIPKKPDTEIPDPPKESDIYVIKDARIVPVTGPVIEKGTLVIQDGKIAEFGEKVKAPRGAVEVEGNGLSVYPGLIDAGTTLGLTEIGSVRGTDDQAELGGYQPDLVAAIGVHADSEIIPVTRANGITTVITRPVGGTITGQASLIQLNGWTREDMAVTPRVALFVNFPAPPIKKGDENKAEKELKEWFERAKEYARVKKAASENGGQALPTDLRLEALAPYATGEGLVILDADSAIQIKAAVEFAEKLGLKFVVSGGREAWKVRTMLAEKKVDLLLGSPFEGPGGRFERYDATFRNAARLHEAGVRFCFVTGDASNVRNLPYLASTASAYGLPREEALAAVTIRPAQILGFDSMTGSIEPGKRADVIVTNGDPLELVTQVKYVFIGGKPVSLENKQTRLYERYSERLEEATATQKKKE